MSYQVGWGCYADLASAASAACSNFGSQTNSLSSGQVQTVSCSGTDSSGGLIVHVETTQFVGPNTVVENIMHPAFEPCMYSDFFNAGVSILVALASVWVLWHSYSVINGLLNSGRGSD